MLNHHADGGDGENGLDVHVIAVDSMAMLAELFTVEDGGTHLTTRTADRLH